MEQPVPSDGIHLAPQQDSHEEPELRSIKWQEKLRVCHSRLPVRAVHIFVIVATALLLLFCVVKPSAIGNIWYELAEGLLMIMFVGEVALNIVVTRGNYFDHWTNIAEFGICVLCILWYVAVLGSFAVTDRDMDPKDHALFLAFRGVGQGIRILFIARSLSSSSTRQPHIDMRPSVDDADGGSGGVGGGADSSVIYSEVQLGALNRAAGIIPPSTLRRSPQPNGSGEARVEKGEKASLANPV